MPTLAYQLVRDRADTPTDYATDHALALFRDHVIPDSIFREVTVAPDTPVAELQSPTGQSYIQDAFDRTETAVERDTATLQNAFRDASSDWPSVLDAEACKEPRTASGTLAARTPHCTTQRPVSACEHRTNCTPTVTTSTRTRTNTSLSSR